MKKIIRQGVVSMALVLSVVMAPLAMAEGSRIAYVDADKLVLESPQYQSLQKNLEAEFKRRDNELVAKNKQIEQLEEKLERDGMTMSETERDRLERDIRSRKHKLKSTLEEYRDEFNIKRGEAREKLQKEIREVIQQVGKADGYDLIFSAGVAYFSDRVDITEKVLDELKRDFKASNN